LKGSPKAQTAATAVLPAIPAMPPAPPQQEIAPVTLLAVLICFFLSGAAGLIYQVAWGKALGLIFGHTAYAVATVLAVFMGGLAAGSAWLGRWSERRPRPLALYGWLEIGTAATGALSLAGLTGVRSAYFAAYPYVAAHDSILLLLRFAGAALVLFLPTFLMGGTLPILVRAVTQNSAELGKRLARLYWVNTAGAVAGTMAAGFLLLPTVGLHEHSKLPWLSTSLPQSWRFCFRAAKPPPSPLPRPSSIMIPLPADPLRQSVRFPGFFYCASPWSALRPWLTKSAGLACWRPSWAVPPTRSP
jgi:MFS family permease